MLEQITYDGFSGGLCTINSGEKCLPNQLQEASNVIILEQGVVRKRYGCKQWATATVFASQILDAYYSYTSHQDKTIKLNSSGATLHTYTTGGLGRFVAFGSTVVHTNGRDAMVKVTSLGAAAILGAPLSRSLILHNDRAFCASGAVLYETAPGTYPSSTVDNFAGGATWTIGLGSEDIVGLASIGRNLFIFTPTKVYIQTGYTKNERQTYLFSSAYGSCCIDSIKNVDIPEVGASIIFLSSDNKICLLTMEGIRNIGGSVQDKLDSIYKSVPVNESYAGGAYPHRARAAVHPHGYYILGYATDNNADSHAAFANAICISIRLAYQSLDGLRHPISAWTGGAIGPSYCCFQNGLLSTSDWLFVGSKNAIGYVQSAFLKDEYVDTQYDAVPEPIYTSIPIKIKTRNEDSGDAEITKTWFNVVVTAYQELPKTGICSFPLKLTQEIDYDLSEYERDVSNPKPTVYQETMAIIPTPGRATYKYEIKHDIVGSGIHTAIQIENFSAADDNEIRISAIKLFFKKGNKV
jgi:hypothetical protein